MVVENQKDSEPLAYVYVVLYYYFVLSLVMEYLCSSFWLS